MDNIFHRPEIDMKSMIDMINMTSMRNTTDMRKLTNMKNIGGDEGITIGLENCLMILLSVI